MYTYRLSQTARLTLRQGDITTFVGDAIVTAANQRMLGGGGVDGAIHRAAGPELRNACLEVPESRPGVRCPTGEARVTPGRFGSLHTDAIIHAVGPIYESDEKSSPLLEGCWKSALDLADQHGYRSVAFPAISCGVFGYPVEKAAAIALTVCRRQMAGKAKTVGVGGVRDVHVFLFGDSELQIWKHVADNMLDPIED